MDEGREIASVMKEMDKLRHPEKYPEPEPETERAEDDDEALRLKEDPRTGGGFPPGYGSPPGGYGGYPGRMEL